MHHEFERRTLFKADIYCLASIYKSDRLRRAGVQISRAHIIMPFRASKLDNIVVVATVGDTNYVNLPTNTAKFRQKRATNKRCVPSFCSRIPTNSSGNLECPTEFRKPVPKGSGKRTVKKSQMMFAVVVMIRAPERTKRNPCHGNARTQFKRD